MNRIRFYLLLPFLFLLFINSCKEDDGPARLSLDVTSITFTSGAQNKSVNVASNQSWQAEVLPGASWCTVTPSSGKGNGRITVSVSKNTVMEERSAIVRVKAGGEVSELTVLQQAFPVGSPDLKAEVRIYEINRTENPLNLIFLGDGFTAEDNVGGGAFDQAVQEGVEALFSVEPYRSYREYFNIYEVVVDSEERGASYADRGIIRKTAFNTTYQGGSAITVDDDKAYMYAGKLTNIDLTKSAVIMIMNDRRYGGTTYMISNGRSVALCPMNRDNQLPGGFGNILVHEAGGHGIGRLADEYVYYSYYPGNEVITEISLWSSYGYYANIDITGDLSKIKWRDFIGLSGYEAVKAFQGGYEYAVGIWRPEEISCMDDSRPYFNAPSRMAIVKRIMSVAGEQFTMEKFIAKDTQKTMPAFMQMRSLTGRSALPPLAPPILKWE